jgi:hypothetical protein
MPKKVKKYPKNMTELCSEIAFREGGKVSVSIGNIREVFRCLADLMIETDKTPLDIIAEYTANRANRRAKK